MRISTNKVVNNKLVNGYDYNKQAWVLNSRYIACGHPDTMNCNCYGKNHRGELVTGNGSEIINQLNS